MLAVESSHVYRRHYESAPEHRGACDYEPRARPMRSLKGSVSLADARPAVKQQRRKKSVRFASSVKTHDGLTPHKRVYDEVVHDLFNRPDDRYRTIRDVVNAANSAILVRLHEQLLELRKRCSEGKTPVLNCGGGRNNVVDERFAPWLMKLANRVQQSVDTIQSHMVTLADPEDIVALRLGDSFRI